MEPWFIIDKVDEQTHIVSEYRHWKETHLGRWMLTDCCITAAAPLCMATVASGCDTNGANNV